MTLVFLEDGRQLGLVSKPGVINERNTGDPVSFRYIPVRLKVILTPGEVPHEVAPVHKMYLISKEESQVLSKSRAIIRLLLSAVVITHFLPFDIRPLLISVNMIA